MDVGVLTQLNQPDVKRELSPESLIVNPLKLETGLRPNSAGIPYTLLLRIEAIGFPTLASTVRLLFQVPIASSLKPVTRSSCIIYEWLSKL